jgi:hypothetical protein
MLSIVIACVFAIPATNLDILPLNEHHPAVSHTMTPGGSFVSSRDVKEDIQQLERFVGAPFEMNWTKLPTKKITARNIWPGPYWPTYIDGINQRWAGENSLSPVEKYAKAFGLDAQRLADAVSLQSGIDSRLGDKTCKTDSDCDGDNCAIRRNKTEGICIPGWFGICHAWAPVAIVEDEAKKAVTVNGVTFEPMDIKALITQIYDTANVGTIFTGQRCDIKNPPTDTNGRIRAEECRDVTPEYFHLVVTNMLGRFDKSFVADVFGDYEVWNHPAKAYHILDQKKMPAQEAMKKYFPAANSTTYIYNQNVENVVYVRTKFDYIVESDDNVSGLADQYTRSRTYQYLLELDANDIIIGGEWVGGSKIDHPDFIYVPVGPPSDQSTILGGIKYAEVKKMIQMAA